MSFPNGTIFRNTVAIALFFILLAPQQALCQRGILDSVFTIRAGTVKTGNALDLISRRTGYSFSYDSRLIDADRKIKMTFVDTRLVTILDSIIHNDSLSLSVIDRFIIISRHTSKKERNDSISNHKVEYVTGTIVDKETGEPLPFATIGLKRSGKGTVSNSNGEFNLNITPGLEKDTLSVSFLGYTGEEIPVRKALGKNNIISMQKDFISIPEILIKSQVPQDIIYKVLKAIPENYGNTPAYMTGFYREGVLKKTELQSYSEAVLEIYKSAYAGTLLGDQIKVYKSRKIENNDIHDTLAIRLKAGLSTCLELDGVRNTFDFLSPESMKDYSYRMTDIVTYDDETAYVIEFSQKENVDLPLYKGSVYINTSDYAVLYADFELNQALLHEMKNSFVTSQSHGFNTWPTSVKYTVSYRKINGRYFLSHVRGDLVFISKKKKKLFNSQFKVFFELAITQVNLNNVTRFERQELAPIHSIFSQTITNYDPTFWGNQDFLKPEDNLLQALRNMNVKLQEFVK
ncbi:MAG TPA: carboxypeptidase-like regulatory domain-containing protein [Bacteroidales bacterium]|nr:carboxypeptidase-like regulatory domain-containing protein [Bacteroidales bacterium]